jgi:ATP-dependent Clp protease ATP-binding subunit ClpA
MSDNENMIKAIDDDVQSVIEDFATKIALKYGHTTIGTQHVYLGLMAFLESRKGTQEKYNDYYDRIAAILKRFGIDDRSFGAAFLGMYPAMASIDPSTDPELSSDNDFTNLVRKLQKQAVQEGRTIEISGLILQLFGDSESAPYNLRRVFSRAFKEAGSEDRTNLLYSSMADEFRVEAIDSAASKSFEDICEKTDFLTDITKMVKDEPRPIVGMKDVVSSMTVGLIGKTKRSIVLIGKPGCGKTEAVYALAQSINERKCSQAIAGKRIYRVNLDAVTAGGSYPGVIETRIGVILSAAKSDKDSILFIDEAQYLFQISEIGSPIINIMKPYLSDGSVSMICAITDSDYNRTFKKDAAFARRFREVHVNEPNDSDTKSILLGIRENLEAYYGLGMPDATVDKIIDISAKYSLQKANPDKSIDMMNIGFSYVKALPSAKAHGEVTCDDLVAAVSSQYGISVSADKTESTITALRKTLLGQDAAIDSIGWSLRTLELGLYNRQKPPLSMLFAGPTGVGKTESARIIAREMFGSDDALIKINMGEYADELAYNKIIGSAPGYVGYDDDTGLLAGIRRRPCSVVLFDEIEKAHPKVMKLLLGLLDDGIVCDSHGDKVSFRNAIIIFTSNVGYDADSTNKSAIGEIKIRDDRSDAERAIDRFFPPELRARINKVVIFDRLGDGVIKSLVERYRSEYAKLSDGRVDVRFSKKDLDDIREEADVENKGARGLDEAVRSQMQKAYERDHASGPAKKAGYKGRAKALSKGE